MNDAWFFTGIFAFIFLIWIATGGPLRPLSWTGPTLAQPEELGGGNYLHLPRTAFSIGGGRNTTLRKPSDNTEYDPDRIGSYLGGLAFGNPSPFAGMVRLNNYVSSASSTNARKEFLRLDAASNAPQAVSISGWTLVSDITAKSARIPQGTTLPRFGSINQKQDIVLFPGERAYLITGGSPLGVSFKENICTGYYDRLQEFTPALPRTCPRAVDEFAHVYGPYHVRDASCVEFLEDVQRCETVTGSTRGLSSTCRAFIDNYLNYNGCVANHKNDANFYGNTWHVYLGYRDSMWRTRNEAVKLLDWNGKTVSAFRY